MTRTNEPRLLPWLRTGLATQITEPAPGGIPTQDAATISVRLRLAAGGTRESTVPLTGPPIRLRSPGEVVGIDPSQVVRRYPEPSATDAEPNFFAHIEFAAPDLPWRYTPAAPDADRLPPWLALVVVAEGENAWLADRPAGRCPILHVTDVAADLPDPAQLWAWAHVHCDDDLTGSVADVLATDPDALRGRLMCPRRLEPNRTWLACLVPTFESARVAGGGSDPKDRVLAWDRAAGGGETLPVYDFWRFQTGPRGDFESLVRKLHPGELAGSVGRRDLDLSDPGGGLPRVPGAMATYAGALVSPAGRDRPLLEPYRTAVKDGLRKLVNAARVRRHTGDPYDALTDDPVVGPPAYGAAAIHRRRVPATGETPVWFEELATEPDRRAMAGVGAEVIRQDQEALMASAWAYAAGMAEVNQTMARARLAWEVAGQVLPGIQALADASLVQLAGPALARLRTATGTVAAAVPASGLPGGAVSGAFRRVVASRPGLSRRGANGQRVRPVLSATNDFLTDGDAVTGRWGTVRFPGGGNAQSATAAVQPVPAAGPRPDLADQIRATLRPAAVIRARLDTVVSGLSPQRTDDAPARLLVTPRITTPMSRRLAALNVDYLVPGADQVPDNTLGLLTVNRVFVEAVLAAANHELRREFRWREFPTPPDATWLRRFWDTVSGEDDILAVSEWHENRRLGGNHPRGQTQANLVLLITGQLLRRYPDTRIYAVEATWQGSTRVEKVAGGDVRLPVFTGSLGKGTNFFGFDLDRDLARGTDGAAGYFFVLEEQPGSPRFGLAPAAGARARAPHRWDALTWANVSPATGPLATFVDIAAANWLTTAGSLPGNGGKDTWGHDAAAMGRITVQRPVRVLVHADTMLPEEL
jgi:hypothetical protein